METITVALILKILGAGFALNVLWEFIHSRLYTTCLEQPWKKNAPLLLMMAAKDTFFILLFYAMTVLVFKTGDITNNPVQLAAFAAFALAFSFIDETISVRRGRWKYAPSMPTAAGVGVTPLLEIAVTGIATFYIVNLFAP